MEERVKLRDDSVPAIDLTDLASASLSDKFLTISRMYKQGEKESFDFILLNLEEARRLYGFLSENAYALEEKK